MVSPLGHLHDLCRTAWPHQVLWAPRLSIREQVTDFIDRALRSKHLSPGEAATLRGLCAWLDSSFSGRALRGALYALWEIALQYLRAVTGAVPDRSLVLFEPPKRPVLLYLDASANGLQVRRSPGGG